MFREIVHFKIIIVCVVFISNCFAAPDILYREGELLIRFSTKADGIQRTIDERNQILASFDIGTVKHTTKLVPGLSLVKLPPGVTVEAALSKLKAAGDILYVEPNYRIRIAETFPDDTRFGDLWGRKTRDSHLFFGHFFSHFLP